MESKGRSNKFTIYSAHSVSEDPWRTRNSKGVHSIPFPLFRISATRQRQFSLHGRFPLVSFTTSPQGGVAYPGVVNILQRDALSSSIIGLLIRSTNGRNYGYHERSKSHCLSIKNIKKTVDANLTTKMH